eukprot:scaffold31622_cov85-Phaeocystis_antarctica.AAC.7
MAHHSAARGPSGLLNYTENYLPGLRGVLLEHRSYGLGYLVNPPSAWPGFSRPPSTPVHEH